jgi:hypothetical protein
MSCTLHKTSEAEFLDEIQIKVLRALLLAIHSFALRFLGGKPDRKPYPLSYGLRNPH